MLPLKPGVSWEGHLFGAISGLFIAFLWRKKGPQRDMFLFYRNLENEEDEYSIFEDK
jgi:membrane associated rhomboid family serine protease